MTAREPCFAALRARLVFALLRALPLPDDPPRRKWLWRRVWLPLMEARYAHAKAAWGRERAHVYDYIPF